MSYTFFIDKTMIDNDAYQQLEYQAQRTFRADEPVSVFLIFECKTLKFFCRI